MKKMNIKETINELDSFSKLLKEAYVFGEDEAPMEDEMGGEQMPEEGMEEEPMHQDAGLEQNHKALDLINQMREISLNGIEMYKNDVTSNFYSVFKKIFLDTDKAMEAVQSKD